MIDTIIFIGILILLGAAMSLQARHDVIKQRDRRKEERETIEDSFEPTAKDYLRSTDIRIEELGDARDREIMRTIELIGHNAYKEMTKRIDRIVKRHRGHQSVTLPLTCGPDTFDGAHELHGLLPGQPIKLVSCRSCGVDTIDAYFNGVRIGRLALSEASELSEIMKTNKVTGAYVAEQNCYGCINSHQMNLIIFFDTRRASGSLTETLKSSLRQVGKQQTTTTKICLN